MQTNMDQENATTVGQFACRIESRTTLYISNLLDAFFHVLPYVEGTGIHERTDAFVSSGL